MDDAPTDMEVESVMTDDERALLLFVANMLKANTPEHLYEHGVLDAYISAVENAAAQAAGPRPTGSRRRGTQGDQGMKTIKLSAVVNALEMHAASDGLIAPLAAAVLAEIKEGSK
jgi:hypothetical protein